MNNSYNKFPISIEAYHTNTPKHSYGCLLINQKQIFKDKAQTIEIDNVLQAGKKDTLAKHINNTFAKAIRGKLTSNLKEFVRENIEVRIENNFKEIENKDSKITTKLEVGYGEELSERLSEHFWVKDMIQTSYGQTYIDLNKKFAMQLENNK